MSGWRGVGWRKIEYHRTDFFRQYLKDSVSTQSNMLLKLYLWSLKFLGTLAKVSEPDQAVFHESRAGMSYFPSRSGGQCTWGRSCAHRCLKLPTQPGPFYSSSLPFRVPRAKQDCLNWTQHCWPCRAAPQYPFCADVRKIWDCFP